VVGLTEKKTTRYPRSLQKETVYTPKRSFKRVEINNIDHYGDNGREQAQKKKRASKRRD